MQTPRMGTVLHWRRPDVHIFDFDPSLINTRLPGFELVHSKIINAPISPTKSQASLS